MDCINELLLASQRSTDPVAGGAIRLDGIVNQRARKSCAEALEEIEGLSNRKAVREQQGGRTEMTVPACEATTFMRGGWLEAYLFNVVRMEFGKRNDVEIAANLGLAYWKNSDRPQDVRIAEIDAAILTKGQLHIVEAKTGGLTTNTNC